MDYQLSRNIALAKIKAKTLLTLLLLFPLTIFGQLTGKVVAVADGDTITILTSDNKQVKVRLHG